MKVLIVGAGEQGYVLTWNLAKHPAVEEIIIIDSEESKAEEVAACVGLGKATARKGDARDVDAVAALADGANLLINAVIPECNEPLMKAALTAKCHYQDMATRTEGGTIDDGYEMQMGMDADFKAIDRTALIHCGMTPGVTNTLAAIGYEELDRCEEVRIKGGGFFRSEVPIQVWSQETYYIDSQTPTLFFDEGQFKRAEPFAGWEYFDFPSPVGRTPVTFHEHEECSTLPRWLPKLGEKGLKHVEFKLGGSEESLKRAKTIVEMGLASDKPIEVKGHQVRPIDLLVKVLPPTTPRDEIQRMAEAGKIIDEGVYVIELFRKAGELPAEAFYVFPPNIQWVNERLPGANRVSYGTSTPAATHARYLLDGRIAMPGVIPCEGVSREMRLQFVDDLAANGIKIMRRSARWIGSRDSVSQRVERERAEYTAARE
jgi:lysine 6-dehydrogenase